MSKLADFLVKYEDRLAIMVAVGISQQSGVVLVAAAHQPTLYNIGGAVLGSALAALYGVLAYRAIRNKAISYTIDRLAREIIKNKQSEEGAE